MNIKIHIHKYLHYIFFEKNIYQRSYFPTQPYNRPVRMLYDSPVYGADHLPHVDLEVEERNWTTLM